MTRTPALRSRGFTLIELLVAIAVFSVLGLMLVTMTRSAINAWRKGERLREQHEGARLVVEQMTRDLDSVFTQKMIREQRIDIIFFCEYDERGRQRLMFVRTMGAQMRDRATWGAGGGFPADGHDRFYTGRDSEDVALRPHGGLAEVVYLLDPDANGTRLFRGVRAPIGMTGSLFDGQTLDTTDKVLAACEALASDVLYCGYEFFTQDPGTGDGMWLSRWDSTRGVIEDFPLHIAGSTDDPSDDVWPWKVRLTLTVRAGQAIHMPTLTAGVNPEDRQLQVSDTSGMPDPGEGDVFVKINDEWIQVAGYESTAILVKTRGARGTRAAAHNEGDAVNWGRDFVVVRDLPTVGDAKR